MSHRIRILLRDTSEELYRRLGLRRYKNDGESTDSWATEAYEISEEVSARAMILQIQMCLLRLILSGGSSNGSLVRGGLLFPT